MIRHLFLVPLLLLTSQLNAQTPIIPGDTDLFRIAIPPFVEGPGHEKLAAELARAVRRGLKAQFDVVELGGDDLGWPLERCPAIPACVDQQLRRGISDAVLFGRLEPSSDNAQSRPDVLIALVAPRWRLSYVERWTEPTETSVTTAARDLIEMIQKRGPGEEAPSSFPEPSSASPSESQGRHSEGGDPTEEALLEEDLEPTPASFLARRKVRRQKKKREKAKAEIAQKEAREQRHAARPSVTWPVPGAADRWRGWAFSVQGGGAVGAIGLAAASQANSDGDLYRWAVRTPASGWSSRVAAHRSLTRSFSVGVEVIAMSAPESLEIYYKTEESSAPYEATKFMEQVQGLLGVDLAWLTRSSSRFQPLLGASVSAWFTPGFNEFSSEKTGTHPQIGPFLHAGAAPLLGARLLLTPKLYLELEGRALIDLMDPFLLPISQDSGISIRDRIPAPESARVVGMAHFGIGFLW